MKKIIVVDDEFLVRKGISSLVEWMEHGYEFCGDYANGKDVIAALPSVKPNVIITDLFMNPVNGFELISYVRENYPQIKLIALSNYNDFENVKKAMKLGASDYIFKLTLSPEEILKTLEEVTAGMEENSVEGSKGEEKEDRSAILGRILSGAVSAEELNLTIDTSASYRCLYLRFEGFVLRNDKALLGSMDLIKNARDVVALMFSHKYPELDILVRDELSLFLFFSDREDKNLSAFASSLCQHLEQCYGFPLGFYLSSSYQGEVAVKVALKEVMEIVDAGFFLENHHYVTLSDLQHLSPFLLPEEYSAESFKILSDASSVFLFCEKLRDLLLYLNGRRFSEIEFKEYLRRLFRYLYVCFDSYNINIDEIKGEEGLNAFTLIQQSDSYEELKRVLLVLLDKYILFLEEQTRLRKEIKEALNYIDENLNKTLTIAQVAEKVNMSESHFAHEFSNQVGLPFNKYCNNRKMERAKKLLLTTDLRISEISEQIGISNSNYFCVLFSKIIGISPKEFRQIGISK